VRDQPLGVLGTGPGSVDHAHLIRQWTDDVILFTNSLTLTDEERVRLEARGIAVADGSVERLIVTGDRLRAVQLVDGRTIPRAAIFIRPELRAHPDGLAAALGYELLPGGFVRVDPAGRTSVAGVWAAGNAADPRAQVITAAGQGSAVAIAINTELVEDDADTAVQRAAAATAA
jgi:thioredoxin reductase